MAKCAECPRDLSKKKIILACTVDGALLCCSKCARKHVSETIGIDYSKNGGMEMFAERVSTIDIGLREAKK